MFCSECGTKVDDTSSFCAECGNATEVKTETAAPVEQMSTSNIMEENVNVMPVMESAPVIKVKKKINKLILGEILLIIALIGGLAYFYMECFMPTVVIENFIDAYNDSEYKDMYDMLLIDEESKAFVTKDAFAIAAELEQKKWHGDVDVEHMEINTIDFNNAEVFVSLEDDVLGRLNTTITLKRAGLQWYIVESDLQIRLLKDAQIRVTKDTQVEVDGVILTDGKIEGDTQVYNFYTSWGSDHLVDLALERRESCSYIDTFLVDEESLYLENYFELDIEEYVAVKDLALKDLAEEFEDRGKCYIVDETIPMALKLSYDDEYNEYIEIVITAVTEELNSENWYTRKYNQIAEMSYYRNDDGDWKLKNHTLTMGN